MFDCSRVPGTEGLDWYVTYTQEHDTNSHVIVMRNNRPWRVDVLRDGKLLSVEELEAQLRHIYDNSHDEYAGVGVLTASNRDIWAKVHYKNHI
jgi:carnitine O-acetyltransferase